MAIISVFFYFNLLMIKKKKKKMWNLLSYEISGLSLPICYLQGFFFFSALMTLGENNTNPY